MSSIDNWFFSLILNLWLFNLNAFEFFKSLKPLLTSICSILGYNLPGDSADIWIKEITKRVENLNPGVDNLVFGYDEIDLAFSKAWEKFQVGDYSDTLMVGDSIMVLSSWSLEDYLPGITIDACSGRSMESGGVAEGGGSGDGVLDHIRPTPSPRP